MYSNHCIVHDDNDMYTEIGMHTISHVRELEFMMFLSSLSIAL